MKNYEIKDNIITINGGFDAKATLYSGQMFRVQELEENKYLVPSGSHACIVDIGEVVTIKCDDVNYFINYFDLDTDYTTMLSDVNDNYALSAIGYCPSLKILRQEKFETVIDFIMSANNNIKRFSKTLNLIAEKYGKQMTFDGYTYSAFPTVEELSQATSEELKSFGCGYRDKYIIATCEMIKDGYDLENLEQLDTMKANKKLCELMGIGEKVADCILLFAYQKYDAFPVDTWIEHIYHDDYNGESTNRKEIRKYFVNKFGKYAGVVQQYLFYYKRA